MKELSAYVYINASDRAAETTKGNQPVCVNIILTLYLSVFIDNILLTIVVPVLPYLLHDGDIEAAYFHEDFKNNNFSYRETFSQPSLQSFSVETEKAAVLLSSKPIIQLIVNPLVAKFMPKIGYITSLLMGNILLLISSLAFAQGSSFLILTVARSLHGIASVIVSVCAMSICAEKFSSDDKMRSKYMGIILGSEALGVLTGYTIGAFIFNLGGKSAPFVVLIFMISANTALLLLYVDTAPGLKALEKKSVTIDLRWCHFLRNPLILMIFGALFFSSSTVAVLEPSLPVWIIKNIRIDKWQTSLIFLPDSFGYLISTTFFSTLPHRIGKWNTASLALSVIGVCLTTIPSVHSLPQLAIPHFCVGLGFGTVDVALIPLLADIADVHQNVRYSSVYALQQGAISLAYIFGSLIAGESVRLFGFSATIQGMGAFIVLYSVLFFSCSHNNFLLAKILGKVSNEGNQQMQLILMEKHEHNYTLFHSDDSD